MNKIYEHVVSARGGHYCHALEIDSAYIFECVIESIIDELGHDERFTLADFIQFFETIELYYYYDAGGLDDCDQLSEEQQAQDEDELYAVNIAATVTDCYAGLI